MADYPNLTASYETGYADREAQAWTSTGTVTVRQDGKSVWINADCGEIAQVYPLCGLVRIAMADGSERFFDLKDRCVVVAPTSSCVYLPCADFDPRTAPRLKQFVEACMEANSLVFPECPQVEAAISRFENLTFTAEEDEQLRERAELEFGEDVRSVVLVVFKNTGQALAQSQSYFLLARTKIHYSDDFVAITLSNEQVLRVECQHRSLNLREKVLELVRDRIVLQKSR